MLNGYKKSMRVAIFISGGGSNLQTLLEMQHQINIVLVITNRKSALGVLKAKKFGKQILYIDKMKSFEEISKTLQEQKVDQIILAGFMKLLPENFVNEWGGRISNIHPSLLPRYPGLNSAERSWKDRVDMGVTIHDVISEVDAGTIKLQQRSSTPDLGLDFNEAELLLRRSEQHLFRELIYRYF